MPLYNDPHFYRLLASSYARLLGKALAPDHLSEAEAATWLYEDAPYAILAHNTAPDPVFIYGNKAAQRRFEYDWDEITRLPSRLSAEPLERAERQTLLDKVARDGFLSGYRGVRVAKSGRRFIIEDGIVWELIDRAGKRHGQAATFGSWQNV